MNAGHNVKKEWVDLKALENPRRSIKEFGSVGCTKDNLGKGKRIISVDCITEFSVGDSDDESDVEVFSSDEDN